MILDAQKQEAALSNKEFLPQGTFPRRSVFWQGVTTEVLNPKTALFFLSFIPQFVNRGSGHVFAQFLVLGSISVALNTSADSMVTALAGPLASRLRTAARFRRRQRTVTGVLCARAGTYLGTTAASSP